MAEFDGGCACGKVRYRLISAPMIVHCCHCTSCRTETGSAYAMIETDRVTLTAGVPEAVLTPSESGKGQTILRCQVCRVALWSHYAGSGRAIAFVRVGTLDDAAAWPPDVHIFACSKLPWVALPEGAKAFDVYYDIAEIWPANAIARRDAAKAAAAARS